MQNATLILNRLQRQALTFSGNPTLGLKSLDPTNPKPRSRTIHRPTTGPPTSNTFPFSQTIWIDRRSTAVRQTAAGRRLQQFQQFSDRGRGRHCGSWTTAPAPRWFHVCSAVSLMPACWFFLLLVVVGCFFLNQSEDDVELFGLSIFYIRIFFFPLNVHVYSAVLS